MQIDESDQVACALATKTEYSEGSLKRSPPTNGPKNHMMTNGPVQNGPGIHSAAATIQNEEAVTQQNDFESFSRFRSRSEGSALGLPKKGSLKKNSAPDTSKLLRRVSFADSNGHQLEQVVSFEVPGSTDTDDDEADFLLPACQPAASRGRPVGERRFVPYFTLPWNAPGRHSMVFAALEDKKVCLENVTINSSWRISGTILVKNMSFDKRVFVRRTLDKWQTYKDVDAAYVCSVNQNVDRFRFELHFAFKLPPGTRLEIALGYEVPQGRGQYWDNNSDNNYAFWFNDKVEGINLY